MVTDTMKYSGVNYVDDNKHTKLKIEWT